jgi:hypothetical protein
MAHTPKRPTKRQAQPVAVRWEVREGTHFPKVIGQFDNEAAARAAVSVNENNRHSYVIEWANPDDTGSAQ